MAYAWVAYLVITLIMAAYAYYLYSTMPRGGQQQDTMRPTTIDAFSISHASEGQVIPLIYGTVRLPGNILWYGNLKTEEVLEEIEVPGGGGGGSGGGGGGSKTEQVVTGYRYYMDMWQAICLGTVALGRTWKNSRIADLGSYIFNTGEGNLAPAFPSLVKATKLEGVCHVALDRFFLGENVQSTPTIHFEVTRDLSSSPIDYAQHADGNNPAAMVYDVLKLANVNDANINFTEFNTAAAYWNSKGFYLNMIFSAHQKAGEIIQTILGVVDGIIYMDEDGKFAIKALDPLEAATASLDEYDFKEFSISRMSWNDTFNDFRASYTNEAGEFEKRTIIVQNPANISMQNGITKQRSVDLTAFNNVTAASKRLWEIMRRLSYPAARIKGKIKMKYAHLIKVGDVIDISHSDYGISSAEFRVTKMDVTKLDEDSIGIEMEQMMETLFDDDFDAGGGHEWLEPDLEPVVLTKTRVFELPYNPIWSDAVKYLILMAREKQLETGARILYSPDGTDYVFKKDLSTYSQQGTLDEAYPDTTFNIDDEQGILYTPYKDDIQFDSISRPNLFSRFRMIIMGDEIMSFQTVTPEGPDSYRLTGIVRGLFNTPIENHIIGKEIWLANLGNNVIEGVGSSEFYIKILPFFSIYILDEGDPAPILVQYKGEAKLPYDVGRIVAVRTGSGVAIQWHPKTKTFETGAGQYSADAQTDKAPPFDFLDDFKLQKNADTPYYITTTSEVINDASAFTLKIWHRVQGYESSNYLEVSVGVTDGTYYA